MRLTFFLLSQQVLFPCDVALIAFRLEMLLSLSRKVPLFETRFPLNWFRVNFQYFNFMKRH